MVPQVLSLSREISEVSQTLDHFSDTPTLFRQFEDLANKLSLTTSLLDQAYSFLLT